LNVTCNDFRSGPDSGAPGARQVCILFSSFLKAFPGPGASQTSKTHTNKQRPDCLQVPSLKTGTQPTSQVPSKVAFVQAYGLQVSQAPPVRGGTNRAPDRSGGGMFVPTITCRCAVLGLICVIGVVRSGPGDLRPRAKQGHKHTLGAFRALNVCLCHCFAVGRRPRTSPNDPYDTHKNQQCGTSTQTPHQTFKDDLRRLSTKGVSGEGMYTSM
jgi:hypothetical protein